jgi:hypothetical protein
MDGESVMPDDEKNTRRTDRRSYDHRLAAMEEKIDAVADSVSKINEIIMDPENGYIGMLRELKTERKNDKEFWETTINEAKRKLFWGAIVVITSATLLGSYVILFTQLQAMMGSQSNSVSPQKYSDGAQSKRE